MIFLCRKIGGRARRDSSRCYRRSELELKNEAKIERPSDNSPCDQTENYHEIRKKEEDCFSVSEKVGRSV